MCKRPLEMVVYDPAAAAQAQQRDAKRPRSPADTGALVPYDAAGRQPLDVEPIHAVPALRLPRALRAPAPAPAPDQVPEEPPPCLRSHILPALRLRVDLPVHFVDRKRVVETDLNAHQNWFRIPSEGATDRLRLILTPQEVKDANIRERPPKKTKLKPQPPGPEQPQPENLGVGNEAELPEHHAENNGQGEKVTRKKKKGKVHGGLPVRLVDVAAGASQDLLLSQWQSSHGTIIKGAGYLKFIRQCSFKENDDVEIWAFKQRAFRLFGKPVYDESPLHVLIVKRDDAQQQCRYCPTEQAI